MKLKITKPDAGDALDELVMGWIQKMEDVHPRCECRMCRDKKTGDEFLIVYDPATDRCLRVWMSKSFVGNEVLEMARHFTKKKKKGGVH